MSGKKEKWLRIDPRTKLFILLTGIFVTVFGRSALFQLGYLLLLSLYGVICGSWRTSAAGLLLYAFMQSAVWYLSGAAAVSAPAIMLISGFGFFIRLYPSGMAAAVLMSATKVSELLGAAVRLRIPPKIYIPMAVMCRYFPVIKEDWRYIRGAMKLRGRRAMTAESLYVPLMMSASKAADELSAAAISRGIENPHPRTCLVDLRIGLLDAVLMAVFAAALVCMFMFR